MELHPLGKVHGHKLDNSIVLHSIGHMNAIVQGKAQNRPFLMVDMGSKGAYSIGAECGLRLPLVYFSEFVFCVHLLISSKKVSGKDLVLYI